MRLNGWQRLWTVLSALYAIVAVPWLLLHLPNEGQYRAEAAKFALQFPDSAGQAAADDLLRINLAQLHQERWALRAVLVAGTIVPPVLLGLVLLTVGWIRSGFTRTHRRGVRVVEAEIEDS